MTAVRTRGGSGGFSPARACWRGRAPWTRLAVYAALSLLAGSPETTLRQGLLAVMVAGQGRREGLRMRARAMARVAAGLAVSALLAAVALLPAAELARNSLRAGFRRCPPSPSSATPRS